MPKPNTFLPKPIQRFREKYPGVNHLYGASVARTIDRSTPSRKADIAICTEKVDEVSDLVIETCYEWHHSAVVPKNHPLSEGEISLERLAEFPILTYSFGYTGRSNIESAFKNAGLKLDVTLAAADTDVIKTYVRLAWALG